MHGVTAAIVAFIFVCIVFPRLVTNRTQFYGALAAVLGVILLDSIAAMFEEGGFFRVFAYVITGLLQIGAIVLLILSAGGLTAREFGRELAGAYEVIRRGEEEKEVIIPLHGQQPRPREADEDLPRRYNLDRGEEEDEAR